MRIAPICISLVLLCGSLQATAQQQTSITATGKLVNIMGIGGESTGWAIQLDDQIAIEGKNVDAIELDGLNKKSQKLENKRVKVVGRISRQHGIERGDWPVLEVISIERARVS